MTHSPGPWRVLGGGTIVDDNVTTVALVATANMDEDARLIAACPEMLELLREGCDCEAQSCRDECRCTPERPSRVDPVRYPPIPAYVCRHHRLAALLARIDGGT